MRTILLRSGDGRCWLAALLALSLVLGAATAAAAADFRYAEGDEVAFTIGQLPAGYTVYWFSDRDGLLARGPDLVTASLSPGLHEITVLIYRTSTQRLVYRTSVTVEILPAHSAPAPAARAGGQRGPHAPGEFEPVRELLLGTPDAYMVEDLYPAILDAVRGEVQTTIYVDNRYVQYELEDLFYATGVDDADYRYVVTPLDSIWIRDYGPLFTKDAAGQLEVVDLDYYPERPYDDRFPVTFARERGLRRKPLRLAWEGGNFTSDGRGNLFATDVLYTYNSGSTGQIDAAVGQAFYGRLHVLEHMRNDGGTGHLDMFALMTGPRSFLLNRFPRGHINARRMDDHAARLEGMGYEVTRVDLADTGFSSYTNGLIVNRVALVPTYGRSSTDQRALAAYRAAGYHAVGIDSRRIIQWSGAIHCVTMTVPR
ncbi:MAG: hypothetical protein KatS3mg102_1406 [Planctomycetota bacterium]|nr:MAG: hypothetical protein KatS3mg102_1406 [Planctomycetota bacterium]